MGYSIRSARPGDTGAVAATLLADDLADTGASYYDEDFVRDQWSSPGFDPAEDAWVVTGPGGDVIAAACAVPDRETLLKSWGVVHPDHRDLGLGSALLGLIEARAAERLTGAPGAMLHHSINDVDEAARAMVLARGYALVRSFRRMQKDIDGSLDPGEPPAGITIRGIDPEVDLQRAHAIFAEAFADEWGYRVVTFAEWRETEVDIAGFDPTLWLIATDEGWPAGALNAIVRADHGWIGELGVRSAWRGRGIGSALLRRSFELFAERGLPRVMLNVDLENPTGAMTLYEKVGMRAVRGFDVYEKPVG